MSSSFAPFFVFANKDFFFSKQLLVRITSLSVFFVYLSESIWSGFWAQKENKNISEILKKKSSSGYVSRFISFRILHLSIGMHTYRRL